ncbi:hypothetical protein MKX01_011384 [Papaver californicum]|nr:hypothetical protein MKX01_011384 [Papaver californicum]
MMGILALITGKTWPSGFGYASTAEQFTYKINTDNLTAIVTGGGSWIGLETSRVLALRGVHVIIGAGNLKAANEAKETILKDNGTTRIDVLKLDLCSIKSVNAFVKKFNALDVPLNILINNAGIMFCPYQLSEDGIEIQFATNHLGINFIHLMDFNWMHKNTISNSGIQGRIVNLSSIVHVHTYNGGIRFDKLNENEEYSDKKAYGQSKLANLLHANELSRRLQEEGANITVNSVQPGLIMTNLFQYSGLMIRTLKLLTFLLWKNVPQGAATTCYTALHPNMKDVTGNYYLDCNEMKPSKYARNETLAK